MRKTIMARKQKKLINLFSGYLTRKTLGLIVFLGILLILPIVLLFQRQQTNTVSNATASTALSFINAPASPQVGDSIKMDVSINPGNNKVSYVNLVVSYDKTLVQPTTDGITPISPFTILDGPVYNQCNGNQCTMTAALSIGNDPTKAISQVASIASVKFQALAGGTVQIAFDPQTQVLSIAPADSPSENVLSTSTPASLTVGGAGNATPIPNPTTPSGGNTPIPTMPTTCNPANCPIMTPPICGGTSTPTPNPTVITQPTPNPTPGPVGNGDFLKKLLQLLLDLLRKLFEFLGKCANWISRTLKDFTTSFNNNNVQNTNVTTGGVTPRTQATSLSFSNNAPSAAVGTPLSLDVMINPGTNAVAFLNLVISYDSSKIKPRATDGIAVNTQLFSQVLDGPTYNTCNGNQCTMSISISVGSDPTKAIKTAGKVATVNFDTIAPTDSGVSQLSFDQQSQALSIASSDTPSENVIANTTPASITITGNGTNPTSAPTQPQPTSIPTTGVPQPSGTCTCPPPPCVQPNNKGVVVTGIPYTPTPKPKNGCSNGAQLTIINPNGKIVTPTNCPVQ